MVGPDNDEKGYQRDSHKRRIDYKGFHLWYHFPRRQQAREKANQLKKVGERNSCHEATAENESSPVKWKFGLGTSCEISKISARLMGVE